MKQNLMGILNSKSPRYRIIRVLASLSLFVLLLGGLVGSTGVVKAAAFTLGSTAQTETTITLSWATSNDVDFYSYHVWFSTTVNGPYTEIYSTSNKGETQYGVNGLVNNTSYYFYIEDKGLFVDYNSNTIQVTTVSNPLLRVTGYDYSSVSLAWTDYNTYSSLEPFVSYTLQISTSGSNGPWSTAASITDPSQNNYRAMGLYATTYWFRFYDSVGPSGNVQSSYSNVVNQPVPLPFQLTIFASLNKMDVGQQDQFTSSVTGGVPPYGNYQWYLNGNPIVGATSSSYSWTPTTAGTYNIILSAQDTLHIPINSNSSTVQVNPLLWINISTSAYTLNITQQAQLSSVYGGGAPPYSFQWYLNGNPIVGATSSSYTFTPTTAGTYNIYATIQDSYNFTASSPHPVQITGIGPPELNVSTSTYACEVGQLAQFSASATGGVPPYGNYQWYLNGNPIAGATSSSYTFTPTTAGTYSIYATVKDNSNAMAASNIVSISVKNPPPSFPFWPIIIAAVAAIIIVIVAVGALLLRSRNRNKVQKTK